VVAGSLKNDVETIKGQLATEGARRF